ncbi:hypothetical protein BB559_002485 [Furculomyces boomerangus]|uniref:DH domain-containing protein n=1 Tax=Furculomyces boomerangus TaxID=61424 RepID=A0A2T9YUZ1_9FUNG|nr:hypothetical protein BB559_002485 [Furculomyces boomerangus]
MKDITTNIQVAATLDKNPLSINNGFDQKHLGLSANADQIPFDFSNPTNNRPPKNSNSLQNVPLKHEFVPNHKDTIRIKNELHTQPKFLSKQPTKILEKAFQKNKLYSPKTKDDVTSSDINTYNREYSNFDSSDEHSSDFSDESSDNIIQRVDENSNQNTNIYKIPNSLQGENPTSIHTNSSLSMPLTSESDIEETSTKSSNLNLLKTNNSGSEIDEDENFIRLLSRQKTWMKTSSELLNFQKARKSMEANSNQLKEPEDQKSESIHSTDAIPNIENIPSNDLVKTDKDEHTDLNTDIKTEEHDDTNDKDINTNTPSDTDIQEIENSQSLSDFNGFEKKIPIENTPVKTISEAETNDDQNDIKNTKSQSDVAKIDDFEEEKSINNSSIQKNHLNAPNSLTQPVEPFVQNNSSANNKPVTVKRYHRPLPKIPAIRKSKIQDNVNTKSVIETDSVPQDTPLIENPINTATYIPSKHTMLSPVLIPNTPVVNNDNIQNSNVVEPAYMTENAKSVSDSVTTFSSISKRPLPEIPIPKYTVREPVLTTPATSTLDINSKEDTKVSELANMAKTSENTVSIPSLTKRPLPAIPSPKTSPIRRPLPQIPHNKQPKHFDYQNITYDFPKPQYDNTLITDSTNTYKRNTFTGIYNHLPYTEKKTPPPLPKAPRPKIDIKKLQAFFSQNCADENTPSENDLNNTSKNLSEHDRTTPLSSNQRINEITTNNKYEYLHRKTYGDEDMRQNIPTRASSVRLAPNTKPEISCSPFGTQKFNNTNKDSNDDIHEIQVKENDFDGTELHKTFKGDEHGSPIKESEYNSQNNLYFKSKNSLSGSFQQIDETSEILPLEEERLSIFSLNENELSNLPLIEMEFSSDSENEPTKINNKTVPFISFTNPSDIENSLSDIDRRAEKSHSLSSRNSEKRSYKNEHVEPFSQNNKLKNSKSQENMYKSRSSLLLNISNLNKSTNELVDNSQITKKPSFSRYSRDQIENTKFFESLAYSKEDFHKRMSFHMEMIDHSTNDENSEQKKHLEPEENKNQMFDNQHYSETKTTTYSDFSEESINKLPKESETVLTINSYYNDHTNRNSSDPSIYKNITASNSPSEVDFGHDKKNISRMKKRREAILELYQTEISYAGNIGILLEIFYKPISILIDSDIVETIFGNIHTIAAASARLCSVLEGILEPAMQFHKTSSSKELYNLVSVSPSASKNTNEKKKVIIMGDKKQVEKVKNKRNSMYPLAQRHPAYQNGYKPTRFVPALKPPSPPGNSLISEKSNSIKHNSFNVNKFQGYLNENKSNVINSEISVTNVHESFGQPRKLRSNSTGIPLSSTEYYRPTEFKNFNQSKSQFLSSEHARKSINMNNEQTKVGNNLFSNQYNEERTLSSCDILLNTTNGDSHILDQTIINEPLKTVNSNSSDLSSKSSDSNTSLSGDELISLDIFDSIRIGTALEEISRDLVDVYTSYSINYMKAIRFLNNIKQKCEASKKTLVSQYPHQTNQLLDTISSCESNPETKKLPFDTYLFLPIQRLTRYNLLLKAILRYTLETNPDYSDLSSAIISFESVASEVDKRSTMVDLNDTMASVLKKLANGFPQTFLDNLNRDTLVLGKRKFLFEGPLVKLSSRKKLYAFLFNDMLLLSTVERKGNLQVYTPYRYPIDLCDIVIRKHSSNTTSIFSGPECFEIYDITSKKSTIFKTPSPQNALDWYDILSKASKEHYTAVYDKISEGLHVGSRKSIFSPEFRAKKIQNW